MVHKECKDESFLDGVIFACFYDDLAKKLIREVKYHGYYKILDDVSKIIQLQLKEYHLAKGSILACVPMHRTRIWERGFNQTEVLAKNLHHYLDDLIFIPNILLRSRNTKKQVGQNKQNRLINLKEAFRLNPKNKISNSQFNNTKIYLVDDVYTTGATLNECAKVLKQSGFKEVYGICFAKSRV